MAKHDNQVNDTEDLSPWQKKVLIISESVARSSQSDTFVKHAGFVMGNDSQEVRIHPIGMVDGFMDSAIKNQRFGGDIHIVAPSQTLLSRTVRKYLQINETDMIVGDIHIYFPEARDTPLLQTTAIASVVAKMPQGSLSYIKELSFNETCGRDENGNNTAVFMLKVTLSKEAVRKIAVPVSKIPVLAISIRETASDDAKAELLQEAQKAIAISIGPNANAPVNRGWTQEIIEANDSGVYSASGHDDEIATLIESVLIHDPQSAPAVCKLDCHASYYLLKHYNNGDRVREALLNVRNRLQLRYGHAVLPFAFEILRNSQIYVQVSRTYTLFEIIDEARRIGITLSTQANEGAYYIGTDHTGCFTPMPIGIADTSHKYCVTGSAGITEREPILEWARNVAERQQLIVRVGEDPTIVRRENHTCRAFVVAANGPIDLTLPAEIPEYGLRVFKPDTPMPPRLRGISNSIPDHGNREVTDGLVNGGIGPCGRSITIEPTNGKHTTVTRRMIKQLADTEQARKKWFKYLQEKAGEYSGIALIEEQHSDVIPCDVTQIIGQIPRDEDCQVLQYDGSSETVHLKDMFVEPRALCMLACGVTLRISMRPTYAKNPTPDAYGGNIEITLPNIATCVIYGQIAEDLTIILHNHNESFLKIGECQGGKVSKGRRPTTSGSTMVGSGAATGMYDECGVMMPLNQPRNVTSNYQRQQEPDQSGPVLREETTGTRGVNTATSEKKKARDYKMRGNDSPAPCGIANYFKEAKRDCEAIIALSIVIAKSAPPKALTITRPAELIKPFPLLGTSCLMLLLRKPGKSHR